MRFRTERWRVHANTLPRVWRHCSGCGETGAYECSENFRVNAQKKIIDVWLIYKCSTCDATWNYPIVSRRAVSDISCELRYSFEQNDACLARKYAFDTNALRRYSNRIEFGEAVEVVRTRMHVDNEIGDRIQIEVDHACHWRLDKLLSRQLHVSRGQLAAWGEAGKIEVRPQTRKSLSMRIQSSLEVVLVGLNALGE